MKQLRKFLALSVQCRILLGKALILIGLIRVGLWMIPFRRFNPLIQGVITRTRRQEPSNIISVSDVIWAIETASYYFPGKPKCLARALTTQVLLNHYGHTCELRIGVAKTETEGFVAHAWIERDGQVLIGGDYNLSSLTLLPSLD